MIKIINTATLSSFQDLGRFGKKSIGVSQSGCLDKFSFLISNFLCGNKKNEGAIEFGLNGENYFDINSPKLIHQPKLGDIVLFPSSLHHRTIPFSTSTDRIIVSFDLQPNSKN